MAFTCMYESKPIPAAFQELFEPDHTAIESSVDIKTMLAHAYKLGLRPVTVAEGEIFTKPNDDLRLRLAAVDRNVGNLYDAANTIKGVISTVLGLDLETLHITTRSMDELRTQAPPTAGSTRMTDAVAVKAAKETKRADREEAFKERGELLPESAKVNKSGNRYTIAFPADSSMKTRTQRAYEMVSLLRDHYANPVNPDYPGLEHSCGFEVAQGNVFVTFPLTTQKPTQDLK